VPKFTVGMLARKETESLVNTLRTYEEEGFLQVRIYAVVALRLVVSCSSAHQRPCLRAVAPSLDSLVCSLTLP
jgi:hypothetical protein